MFQLLHVHTNTRTCTFPAVSVCCQAQAERGGKSGGVTSNMLQLLAVLSEREATYHLDIAPRVSRAHTNQTACQLLYMNSAIHYLLSTQSRSYLTQLTSSHFPLTTAASCFSLHDNEFHSQHTEGLTQL